MDLPSQCMNPCCPPEDQDPCCTRTLQPHAIPQYVCSPATCAIFGGHDANYDPTARISPTRYKGKHVNSLGTPVGMAQSSYEITVEEEESGFHKQRFATYLKAFAKTYLTPEGEWDSDTLDALITEGQILYTESAQQKFESLLDEEEEEEEVSDDDPDPTPGPDAEAKIKRFFQLEGFSFKVEILDKFELKPSPIEKTGDSAHVDLPLQYLRTAMKEFFRERKYCLITFPEMYLMVWRAKGAYFVADFYGRNIIDFASAPGGGGVAMVICVRSLDNVCHLILNLSELDRQQTFNLRELKLVQLTTPEGRTMTREISRGPNEYELLSDSYAVLRSALHLTLKKHDPIRSRSALPVAVVALLASKIDHPSTWNRQMLDRIICYGVNVCRCCWEQCGLPTDYPIDLYQFPTQLQIGQFLANYCLGERKYQGIWRCVPNYINSEFVRAIQKAFDANDNHLLIQIGQQIYTVWKNGVYIYLLDPYRHRLPVRLVMDEDGKSATLRMFNSFDMFMKVFTQMLLESNPTSEFFIHTLVITSIESLERVGNVPRVAVHLEEQDTEIQSLNETICFDLDDLKCLEELGQISEDDVSSGIVDMDLKPPPSPSISEALEEEEGALDDLGEFELSDGTFGGGKKKKKQRKSRKPSMPRKSKHGEKKKRKEKVKKQKTDKKNKDKKKKGKKKIDKEIEEKPTEEEKEKDKEKETDKKKDKDKEKQEDKDKDKDKTKDKEKKEEKETPKPPQKETEGDKDKEKKPEEKSEENKEKDEQKEKESEKEKEKEKEKENDKKDEPQVGEKKEEGPKKPELSKYEEKDKKKQVLREPPKSKAPEPPAAAPSKPRKLKSFSSVEDYEDKSGKCPGYCCTPQDMAVVGSETGSYQSICKLLTAGFKCTDRVMVMTEWANYVVFRQYEHLAKAYYVYDGCTCNVNRFRHLDLCQGTSGFLRFRRLYDVISYMLNSRKLREDMKTHRKQLVDEICKTYLS